MYIGWELSLVQGDDQFIPLRNRVVGWALTCLVRFLRLTWRVYFHDRSSYLNAKQRGAVVFAFWHGEHLPLTPIHASNDVLGMASFSKDGDLVANVLHRFGYSVVRGSSSRGGEAAFQVCLKALQTGVSPALAVDGPRGPYHRVHHGAVRLSQQSGCPIVYVVCHANVAIRLSTWDRFMIPYPGARVDVAYGCLEPQVGQSTSEMTLDLEARMEALASKLRRPSSSLSGDSVEP